MVHLLYSYKIISFKIRSLFLKNKMPWICETLETWKLMTIELYHAYVCPSKSLVYFLRWLGPECWSRLVCDVGVLFPSWTYWFCWRILNGRDTDISSYAGNHFLALVGLSWKIDNDRCRLLLGSNIARCSLTFRVHTLKLTPHKYLDVQIWMFSFCAVYRYNLIT